MPGRECRAGSLSKEGSCGGIPGVFHSVPAGTFSCTELYVQICNENDISCSWRMRYWSCFSFTYRRFFKKFLVEAPLGEAVVLMRKVVADAVTPVGWPTVGEFLNKLAAKHVQIYACGACSRARAVSESDLASYGAKFGSPPIFVSLVEWADHIITE